jgi:hypothetical protein
MVGQSALRCLLDDEIGIEAWSLITNNRCVGLEIGQLELGCVVEGT